MNTETLRAYHSDPKVKTALLRRISAHEKADRLIQGTYGAMNGHWRGCAVSCSLADAKGMLDGESVTDGLHHRYPDLLGIPEWLAHLEDRVFEGLPTEDAMDWPRRFARAIPVGASFEGLADRLAIRRLREECLPLSGQWPESVRAEVVAAIELVIAALEGKGDRESARSAAESAAWSAAWSAARSAAESAGSAAESAAESAAWSAGSAAESAAWSAASAAWSAAWSAGSAAESAAFQREADRILEELQALGSGG